MAAGRRGEGGRKGCGTAVPADAAHPGGLLGRAGHRRRTRPRRHRRAAHRGQRRRHQLHLRACWPAARSARSGRLPPSRRRRSTSTGMLIGFTDVKSAAEQAADGAGKLAGGAGRRADGADALADGARQRRGRGGRAGRRAGTGRVRLRASWPAAWPRWRPAPRSSPTARAQAAAGGRQLADTVDAAADRVEPVLREQRRRHRATPRPRSPTAPTRWPSTSTRCRPLAQTRRPRRTADAGPRWTRSAGASGARRRPGRPHGRAGRRRRRRQRARAVRPPRHRRPGRGRAQLDRGRATARAGGRRPRRTWPTTSPRPARRSTSSPTGWASWPPARTSCTRGTAARPPPAPTRPARRDVPAGLRRPPARRRAGPLSGRRAPTRRRSRRAPGRRQQARRRAARRRGEDPRLRATTRRQRAEVLGDPVALDRDVRHPAAKLRHGFAPYFLGPGPVGGRDGRRTCCCGR